MADKSILEFEGFEELSRSFDGIDKLSSNPGDAALVAGQVLKENAAEAFQNQSDVVSGVPWEPLSELTKLSRRGSGGKPLRDTGTMFQAVLTMDPSMIDSNSASVGPEGNAGTITIGRLAAIHNGSPSASSVNEIVIRPVAANWLTIPISPLAAKSSSIDKFKQKNRRLNLKWAQGPNSRVLYSQTKRGTKEDHWLLIKESRLPHRRFLGYDAIIVEDIIETIIMSFEELREFGGQA